MRSSHSRYELATMEATQGHHRLHGRLDGERGALTLKGSVDLSSGQAVRDAVSEALDAGAHEVVLDLAPVSFLDSSGLNALLNTARDVHRRGADLRCDAPHGGEPRVVIDLAGVAKLLHVAD